MKNLNALKMARYFFELNNKASHLDTLVVYSLLKNPGCSPTDIQDDIFGCRRGGSVDNVLSRLSKAKLIEIKIPNEIDALHRREVIWTNAGEKWLNKMSH